jgi:hypothetical protein
MKLCKICIICSPPPEVQNGPKMAIFAKKTFSGKKCVLFP